MTPPKFDSDSNLQTNQPTIMPRFTIHDSRLTLKASYSASPTIAIHFLFSTTPAKRATLAQMLELSCFVPWHLYLFLPLPNYYLWQQYSRLCFQSYRKSACHS